MVHGSGLANPTFLTSKPVRLRLSSRTGFFLASVPVRKEENVGVSARWGLREDGKMWRDGSMGDPAKEDAEPMRYEILGEDCATLEEKLAKYSGRASWEDLKKHLEAGTLIYADPALDLGEVSRAFARDESDRVKTWLKKGDLLKPSRWHGDYWESIQAIFECQVVSPFVLIQPIDETAGD